MLAFVILLVSGCGPSRVVMKAGECNWPSIGDTLEGIATLHAYPKECRHCGAYVTQEGCKGKIGYRNATDEARQAYKQLTLRGSGESSADQVERRVFVSGAIVPDGADGTPLLNATRITLAR